MKPGWDQAPVWAKYLAQDADGKWHWFAEKPSRDLKGWRSKSGQWQPCHANDGGWKTSLERCLLTNP